MHDATPAPEGRIRPQDVPPELVTRAAKASIPHFESCDFGDSWQDCQDCRRAYDRAHYALAAVLPERERRVRKAVLTELLGTPEEIAAREAEAATKTRDDTVDICERARPGEHARRVLEAAADQLDAMPATDGAAIKGPYWYRDGWKQATGMLRDWADYPPALADRIARRDGQRGAESEHE